MKVVIAAAGTGGHINPGIAIANKIMEKEPDSKIIFIGTDFSADYYKEVIDYIKDKEVMINVISKSGNTLEPNIAFEIINYILEGKYSSEELEDRIIITTDKNKGSLRTSL